MCLGTVFTGLGKREKALEQCDVAAELEPSNPASYTIRGIILRGDGKRAEAEASFRKAINVAVEYDYGTMLGLLQCCTTIMERRLALNFLRTELTRHLIFGDGLLAFRELLARHFEPNEVLTILNGTLNERPDLWQAWAAVARELNGQQRYKEAVDILTQATERLPVSIDLWNELATLHQTNKEFAAELAVRERVLTLAPGDANAMCALAECLERVKKTEQAQALLEEILASHPRDARAHYLLAVLLWKREQQVEAISRIKEAVRCAPEYGRAWEALENWARIMKQPELVLQTAQALAEERNQDSESWLCLARLYLREEQEVKAMGALDEAIVLRPASIEGQRLRIRMLIAEDRLENALEICRLPTWGATAPAEMQVMEAHILRLQGNREAAMAKLESTLADAPHLAWGWEMLAEWYLDEGKEGDARDVLERMQKAVPHDPAPLLWLASWRHGEKDYPEATDLIEKALRLQPGCVPALIKLMHIQVETKQFNAVRDTIETLRAQGVTEWAMAGEACVALMQRDVGFAATRFLEILAIPNAEAGAVEFLARTFSNFEVLQAVRKPLEEIVTREQAYVGVGGIWVNACAAANGKLPSLASILHLSEKVRQKAAVQYLRWVAFRGEKRGFPGADAEELKVPDGIRTVEA